MFVGHVFCRKTCVYKACWCPFVYIGSTTIQRQTTRSIKDVCLRYGIYVLCGEKQLIKSHQDAFSYSRSSQVFILCTSHYKSQLVTLLECVYVIFFLHTQDSIISISSLLMWEQIYNKTFTFLSALITFSRRFPTRAFCGFGVITLIFLLLLSTQINLLGSREQCTYFVLTWYFIYSLCLPISITPDVLHDIRELCFNEIYLQAPF